AGDLRAKGRRIEAGDPADTGASFDHRAPDRLDPDANGRHQTQPGNHHPAFLHRSPSTRCFRHASVRPATAFTKTSPTTHWPGGVRITGSSRRSSWVMETRMRGGV